MTRRSLTKRGVLVLSAALAVAVPLTAQQPQSGQDEQQLRYQLQTFEGVLQSAVRHGGDAFARDQASVIPPGIQLTSDDPMAFGFAPPESGGLFFLVVVPPLRVTVDYLLQRPFVRQTPPAGTPSPAPLQNVAGGSRDTGVLSPMAAATPGDPMKVSPVVEEGRCATRAPRSSSQSQASNPNREYAIAVCDALMDAMLDYSGPLPVKEEEWLIIAAIDGTGGSPGVLNSPYSYTTYLSIKGSDLVALRQGKISKSEARKLVSLKQR